MRSGLGHAVDLPPADRVRYLDSNAVPTPSFARELAAVFENSGGFTSIVEHAAAGTVEPDDPWIGRRLSPYRVLRLIGRGGSERSTKAAARMASKNASPLSSSSRHSIPASPAAASSRNARSSPAWTCQSACLLDGDDDRGIR